MRKIKFKKYWRWAKKHHKLILVSGASAGLILLGVFALWISSFEMPDLKSFEARTVLQSTKIYDRTGEVLLFDVNQDLKREVIPFDQISQNVKNATVAIEDENFYKHGGIQIKAILRAVWANLTGGTTQGGSTITQQVIKNSLLTSEKVISRKLKEWILAVRLEKIMSKEDILNVYLNESPYGGSIYGIEEASQTFFGKHASEVTLAEAAYLAAIPNAPTYYSPYGKHTDQLVIRKNLVLQKMLENKLITSSEYELAKKEMVVFKEKPVNRLKAAHFVDFIRQYLENKYGEKAVLEDGLKVTTTLDYSLQQKAEEIVKNYALENEKTFKASNAALVAIDPKTGQILTMVGSRDYFDTTIDGNFNVALAHRQPGSTFKPFVYATAFKKGYTPDTILFDLPTEFQSTCTPEGKPKPGVDPEECYMPENYDGKYLGPMTLRDALAQSRNVPAIKTLYLAGIKDSLNTAKTMGITSLGEPDQYGLTLVLGGGEVSPLELTNTYGTFANAGVKNPYVGILKVETSSGETLEEFTPKPELVLEEQITYQISDILSDNKARTPAFGSNSPLYFKDRPVAVKTGTTNDYRDVWIVGYTPNLVVGAWAGNNNNSPMEKKTAGMIISPMWRAFMDQALSDLPKEYFPTPEPTAKDLKPVFRGIWQGYESFVIDKISGKLATNYTPEETRQEIFFPEVHEILHWVDKTDPYGPVPERADRDSQYKLWEYPVQKWVNTQYLPEPTKPTTFDNIHTPEKGPHLTIVSPKSISYDKNQKIYVRVDNKGDYPLIKIDFYINGVYVGSSNQEPFLFSFTPNQLENIRPENTLKVIGTDSVYNKDETETTFSISI